MERYCVGCGITTDHNDIFCHDCADYADQEAETEASAEQWESYQDNPERDAREAFEDRLAMFRNEY